MKFFSMLIFVVSYFWIVSGWVGTELHNGPFLGYCSSKTYTQLKKFKVGETQRLPGLCASAKCTSNGNIHYTGCSPVAIEPPCMIVDGDKQKPFPKCCYEIVCPEDKNI